jgi:alanine racemase
MRTSRRRFLQAAATAPAAGLLQEAPKSGLTVLRDSSFDPWIEIDRAKLRHNVAEISRLTKRPILAVIKNNGYGSGVTNVARALEPVDAIYGFAVVKLHEAVTLRDAGIRKPVLSMGPFDTRELAGLLARGIMPMVYTPVGNEIERAAAARGRPAALHICVDTGIGRVGVPFRQAATLIRDLAARQMVQIAGTMMTFTEDPAFDPEQLKRFQMLSQELQQNGVKVGRLHTASSFALFQHPDAFLDMVRPGMAIYGIYSEPQFRSIGMLDLQPAVSLKARVAYVKRLEAGDTAGYERAYKPGRPVWIATVPVGHADGLPRAAAQGGRMRIGGAMYPVVASISASHSILEIGDEPRVKIGDVVTVFDAEAGSRPEDLAESCKSSVYDLTMHLHADLPRRVV